ncbi:hypothetical protein D3C85_1848290 [compost metagenome]
MYAVIKEILNRRGVNIGSVRAPLMPVSSEDSTQIDALITTIDQAIARYCS